MARLRIHPLTGDRWADLEQLFGKSGACYGCWCMYWRLTSKQMQSTTSRKNKAALKSLAKSFAPGLLGYLDDQPVGWISLGPKSDFARLANSRVIKPLDEIPVWSIVCFFVQRNYRGQGVALKLLKSGVKYARGQNAPAIEAYPICPAMREVPQWAAYSGTLSLFEKAGFKRVGETKSKSGGQPRVIVRRFLKAKLRQK